MSRRALSDNLDRVVSDPGDEATGSDGRFSASIMRRAIEIASLEQPHPNPRVGAVVVADGEIVGEGAHERAGEPHAEVLALAAAGDRAQGATVYVTLEPCAHHGRTPPCADALVAAGVAKVVVGTTDPDSRVSGGGVARLRKAGVDVVEGVMGDAVEKMDPGYFHHRRTGRPLVTLKMATTLDGQIAAADRTSKWITGEDARLDGHRLRAESDVIIVGAGTVIDDDPSLDVRLDGYRGRHPRPVIVAGSRPLDQSATLFDRDPIVYAARQTAGDSEVVVLPEGQGVDLTAMIDDLGGRGYATALVEGGATLAAALIRSGLVDRIVVYLAAKLGLGTGIPVFSGEFATITDALPVEFGSVERIGSDLRVEVKLGS